MALDTEKMVDEALAMKLAVTGDAHGDYFHAFNWSDKPHRVVYDAAKIINAAAAELTTLRAEVKMLREALGFYAKPQTYRAPNLKEGEDFSCAALLTDRGRIAKEALK